MDVPCLRNMCRTILPNNRPPDRPRRSAIGSSTEAVASGNADAAPQKTCSRVHERRSCDGTRSADPAGGAATAAAAAAAVAGTCPARNGLARNCPAVAVNGPASATS